MSFTQLIFIYSNDTVSIKSNIIHMNIFQFFLKFQPNSGQYNLYIDSHNIFKLYEVKKLATS